RADSIAQAGAFLQAMAGFGRGNGLEYHTGLYFDTQLVLALAAGAIGSAPSFPALVRFQEALAGSTAGVIRLFVRTSFALADVAGHSALLLASSMLLAAGTHNPFIYFRF